MFSSQHHALRFAPLVPILLLAGGCLDLVYYADRHIISDDGTGLDAGLGTSSSTSSSSSSSSGGSTSASSGSSTSAPTDAGLPPTQVIALEIGPAPLVMDVDAAVGGSLTLTVTAVLFSGMRRPAVDPVMRSESPDIGLTFGDQFVVPADSEAGDARVRVRAEGVETLVTILVRVGEHILASDVAQDSASRFDNATVGDGSFRPVVDYPFSDVVVPTNVAPMTVQLTAVAGLQVFHVGLVAEYGGVHVYTRSTGIAFDASGWGRMMRAHAGRSVRLIVETMLDGASEKHVSTEQAIIVAQAPLSAMVTWWSSTNTTVMKSDVQRLDAELFGVVGRPEDLQAGARNCYGCHTTSAGGRRTAVTFYEYGGPGVIVNPVNPDGYLLGPGAQLRWNFAALSPDLRLMLTNYQQRIELRDVVTGALLANGDPFSPLSAHPAWSPRGDAVAYAANIANNNIAVAPTELDFDSSDLTLRSIDLLSGFPGQARIIVAGGGQALYYPAFSHDGRYVAFNRGAHSRSSLTSFADPGFPATLELIDVNATDSAPVVLAGANPDSDAYRPSFAPAAEGGYLWVAYFSRRAYGTQTAGTRRRQVWIAAIDPSSAGLTDPSHPPFWLSAQDPLSANMLAQLSPPPCASSGEACGGTLGCCTGYACREVPNIPDVFQCIPAATACRVEGELCTDNGDCCQGEGECFDPGDGTSRCTPRAQQCRRAGEACTFNVDCCVNAGFCAADGTEVSLCGS